MSSWLSRIVNSGLIIPTSVLALGGFWVFSIDETDSEIQKLETKLQLARRDVIQEHHVDRANQHWRRVAELDQGQAKQLVVKKENLYPYGNPPYKDLVAASTKKTIRKTKLERDSKLDEELEAMRLTKKKKAKNLPRSLNDPVKRRKAIKMLTDTYKVFDRDIEVATQVVQDAIDNNSRTEAEINEALEAINQMKRGRQMLIEKIQVIEDAQGDEEETSAEEDDLLFGE